MAIDTFTIAEFDKALPHAKNTNEPLFTHIGIIYGEHCWVHERKNVPLRILIRSSIKQNGISADVGDDSIKLYIEQKFAIGWRSINKHHDAYTTRVPGWANRLTEKIKEVSAKMYSVKKIIPPNCKVAFNRTEGLNKGRPMAMNSEGFVCWLG